MGVESWLVLLIIIVVFVFLTIFVVKSEEANDYYLCYNKNEYKDRAANGKCKGYSNAERCKKCPYHKRYEKSGGIK